MGNREYTGLSIDGDVLRIARIRAGKKGMELIQLDRIALVESTEKKESASPGEEGSAEGDGDSVFGISKTAPNGSGGAEAGTLTTTDTDLLEMVESVDEDSAATNQMLIHNLLESIDRKKAWIGLSIAKGVTTFEILNNINYSEIRKKERTEIIHDRLKSIYGDIDFDERYISEIRDDGAMILASNETEPALLKLIDQGRELYHGSVFIQEILPEEIALAGMVRTHYKPEENEITGIVQMGQNSARLLFLKGRTLLSVNPMIHEGTRSAHLLSTIFSKILFQLDTGKLPSLERLVIADNTMGEEPVAFLKKNLPDVEVEAFRWKPELLAMNERLQANAGAYTSAIAAAIAATGSCREAFGPYSFLPERVIDRQKVFKLDWHGILLLIMIALTPVVFNHFYQQRKAKIADLKSEIVRTDRFIASIQPVVDKVQHISAQYDKDQKKFDLIRNLSRGTHKWSSVLSALNKGMRHINSIWLTSMSSVKDGVMLQGYSLYRNRIPRLTDLFAVANLQNVKYTTIRDIRAYTFVIVVKEALKDTAAYSPKADYKIPAFTSPSGDKKAGGNNHKTGTAS